MGLAAISCPAYSAERVNDTKPQTVQLVADKAQQYNVPLPLALGIIETESSFNPRAHNRGNWGLGQIQCGTARSLGMKGSCDQLLDPTINLNYSMSYLRAALDVAKDDQCVAATLYNRGLDKKLAKYSRYCVRVLGLVDIPKKHVIVSHNDKEQ